jgi:hypothetical protein
MNDPLNEVMTDHQIELVLSPENDDGCDSDEQDKPVVPEQFSVHDAKTASWILRKVNESRIHRKRVAAWAEREIRRAERDEEFLLFRFGKQLEEWAAREISMLRGRRRSVALPGGTIGFRHVPSSIVIDDDNIVLTWAKEHCVEAVVTVEKLSRSIVKAHIEATGELPARGVHIEGPHEKFYVK